MECTFGKDVDNAGLLQSIGHADQGAEPDQRIPGFAFGEKVVPRYNFSDEQCADAGHCYDSIWHSVPGRGDPAGHDKQQYGHKPPFIAAGLAHFFQFIPGQHASRLSVAYTGRMQAIYEPGNYQQSKQTRNTRSDRPAQPGEIDVADPAGKICDKRVGGHAGKKHRRSCVGGMESHQLQKRPKLPPCSSCFRTESARDAEDNRTNDAAATGSIRRDERG